MNDYSLLCLKMAQNKDFCDTFVYGKSYFGQELVAFHKGSYTGKQILITGGIHAREYISSFLVLDLLEKYNDEVGIYFIPLINPDGVKICTSGVSEIDDENIKNFLLKINKNSSNKITIINSTN